MSIFNKVSSQKLPSNRFKDLSYSNKLDMQVGLLYPIHVEEIVPGDIFMSGHGAMVRSQPMVSPVMHNFNYNVRWFFVPNRLTWDNFESFITDQEKGKKQVGLSEPHVHPYLNDKTTPLSYIHDLMGVSPSDGQTNFEDGDLMTANDFSENGLPIDALPFRAYNLIWNEYFKDENTMDDVDFPLTDGSDETVYDLLRVSWKKDYFTSALPFAQRGDPVQLIGRVILGDNTKMQKWVGYNGQTMENASAIFTPNASIENGSVMQDFDDQVVPPVGTITNMDPNGTLEASVSFSAIRKATAIQRFLERSALGGNRYAELLLAHFGVRSSDASLQRPQYLGGGVAPINVSPVEQTSETATTPQGTLAGKGVGIGSMYFSRPTLFTEHGWLLGLAFIRPDADYCNGIRRQLIKRDRFDYFWPDFQNIGEQEIYNWELYTSASIDENNGTFGYQSRYSHYKWHGNEVHGAFRGPLRSWVAPREFDAAAPTLSKEFIECNLDIGNNMAVDPKVFPPFMVEAMNVVNARRPMFYFNRGIL